MLKRRTLIALGGAAAGSIALALVLTPNSPDREELPGEEGRLAFPGLAPKLETVQRLEMRKNDSSLVLLRDGERWLLPDKGNYPVRPERVRELLVGLTELRLAERRTADPGQLAQLGLDDPSHPGSTAVLLRALDAQGAPVAELVVGRRRVRTQGNVPESVYVRRPEENQSWLAEGRLAVDTDAQLWVDRDIANIAHDRLRQVTVHRVNEPPLVLARGGEADAKLKITEPAEPPPTDDVSLDEVGRSFEFLTFIDVKPEAQTPGTALGESRFAFSDGLAVTVQPFKDGDAVWVRLQAEGTDAEAQQLNARWRGWAYQVGSWKEKAFIPRLEDLRQREPAHPAAAVPQAGAAPAAAPAAPQAATPPQPAAAPPAAPPANSPAPR